MRVQKGPTGDRPLSAPTGIAGGNHRGREALEPDLPDCWGPIFLNEGLVTNAGPGLPLQVPSRQPLVEKLREREAHGRHQFMEGVLPFQPCQLVPDIFTRMGTHPMTASLDHEAGLPAPWPLLPNSPFSVPSSRHWFAPVSACDALRNCGQTVASYSSLSGPGGSRGLQNRCGAARAVLGGFDSHALPPHFTRENKGFARRADTASPPA
jgi:hypothetical protein